MRFKEYIDKQTPQWTQLLQTLIQFDSVYENEQDILKFISQFIQRYNFEPIHVLYDVELLQASDYAQKPISAVEGRYNIVVKVSGQSNHTSLVFNSHVDVVPATDETHWSSHPFSGHIDIDNRIIYGRGAMDDKAGVAICLGLLAVCQHSIPPIDLVFQFVIEDEITGNGTLLCLEHGYTADAAVIVDGTRLDKAINQHAGQLQLDMKIIGKPASVVVSHMGQNSAEILAALLLELKSEILALNQTLDVEWQRYPFPYQFVVQSLQSQSLPLTVPTVAHAKAHITFPPPYTLSKMKELIEFIVSTFIQDDNVEIQVSYGELALEPVSSFSKEFSNILQNTATMLNRSPIEIVPSTGFSDMRHFANHRIDTLLYGPGRGYNPHRHNEHYYLDDLPEMIYFFWTLIEQWGSYKADF